MHKLQPIKGGYHSSLVVLSLLIHKMSKLFEKPYGICSLRIEITT